MTSTLLKSHSSALQQHMSMQQLGEAFIEALPKNISALKIPGRMITSDSRRAPISAYVEHVPSIQLVMHEVLCHDTTQEAQSWAEQCFHAFLAKQEADGGVLRFFNGWNETHKTTSLVSAKIIMRLAADAVSIPTERQLGYSNVMAHMHEVAKDDFGLGHEGHDGMYDYMTDALNASRWKEAPFIVSECNEFSEFLYNVGVAGHKFPMDTTEHKQSILNAMMTSIASELWNGREYNFIAQYIEEKLLSYTPSLSTDNRALRNAKGYVMGHSGEVENRHGLHALAAAQAYSRNTGIAFDITKLKEVMLDYNQRVGNAFHGLHRALTA